MRLANRSLGGAVAVAAAVESGAAAAGEAAAAAVVAGAAGAGDVAPSAKRHTSSKHNTKPQPAHYETGRGSTLAVPTKRGPQLLFGSNAWRESIAEPCTGSPFNI
jgi:hypothetical protein